MKSLCNIPSGVFRNFWRLILKQNSMLDKIRTFICVRVGYKKSVPPNHHLIYLASPVMQKSDLRDRFFYPTHTLMVRFQDFFLHFQLNLVTFFPFLKKNPNLPKKKKIFFFEDCDFHSVTTHTSYMMTIYSHCILFLLQFFDGKGMCNTCS